MFETLNAKITKLFVKATHQRVKKLPQHTIK